MDSEKVLDKTEERPLSDDELTEAVLGYLRESRSSKNVSMSSAMVDIASLYFDELKLRAEQRGDNSRVEALMERIKEEFG